MNIEAAEKIVNVLSGEIYCEVYEGYSGRGMYGEKTTGIVCNSLQDLLAATWKNIHELAEANINMIDIVDIEIDNMGQGIIVY